MVLIYMSNQQREIMPVFRTDAWALYLKGFEVISKESSSNRIAILKPELKLQYEYFDNSKSYGLYLSDEETSSLNKIEKKQTIFITLGFFLFLFGLIFLGLSQIFDKSSFLLTGGIILLVLAMMTLPTLLFNDLSKNHCLKKIKIKYGIKNSP